MLVTYLPDAVAKGATVLSRCRVDRLAQAASRVERAECTVLGSDGYAPAGKRLTMRAKRFVLSAGGIGTPAILIRSGLGGGAVGKRTFLHPVIGTLAVHKDPVEGFYGAPQSVASHALAERGDEVGLFLEAAPVHPMIMSTAVTGFGAAHHELMSLLPRVSAHIALAIDGFHPSETGGTVTVRPSGAPLVDYVIPERVWDALRVGQRTLARIDLATGAERIFTGHDPPIEIKSERDLALLDGAAFSVNRIAVFSAHVMGGAAMGDDPTRAVVRSSDLRHHTVDNLHIVDGSVLPTSLGVNPQETIYGIAHLMGARLAAIA
jgi:choline dehydrogenase-like flavoprotein